MIQRLSGLVQQQARFGQGAKASPLAQTPDELITPYFINLYFQDTFLRGMAGTLRHASENLTKKWHDELFQVHSPDIAQKIERAVMAMVDSGLPIFPVKKRPPEKVLPFNFLGPYLQKPLPAEETAVSEDTVNAAPPEALNN